MHQAIYLDEDVIYLDEMNIAKNVINKSSPPILQLFCFIYKEVKLELGELDNVPDRAIELAEQFQEENLEMDSQLFGKDSFNETLNLLKEKLDDIDIETTYKDEDYWHFFEAIEAFLYGERQEDNEGIYWGFSSFYDVWEDMCQTYIMNYEGFKERVVYADIDGVLTPGEFYKGSLNPFKMHMNKISKTRKLRPDLVLESEAIVAENIFSNKKIIKHRRKARTIGFYDYPNLRELYPKIYYAYRKYTEQENNLNRPGRKFFFMYEENFIKFREVVKKEMEELNVGYEIIDYKYMRISDYENYSPFHLDDKGENKVKEDIHKQLVYEWTVQRNWEAKTKSEFWIPFYSEDVSILLEEKIIDDNNHFNQSQVKVIKVNFKTLQEFYIKQDMA